MLRFRHILAALAVAAALVAAAAMVAPYAVDTATVRQMVSGWIGGLLGREVRIDGAMRFTLLPIFGFVVEDLSVAGTADADQEPLLRVQRASLEVTPWPLIHRQVIVERIHLQGPRVHLARDADGRVNWEAIAPRSADPATNAGKTNVLLEIEQVAVAEGSLHFQDARTGRDIVVSDIAFRRRGKGSRSFVLGARIESRQDPMAVLERFTAALHLSGSAAVVPTEGRYAIEAADLRLALHRKPTDDASPLAVLEAVLSAEASPARINLENLRMTAPGTRVAGATTGRLEKGTPILEGRLHLEIQALKDMLAAIGVVPPPDSPYRLPRTGNVELSFSARPGKLIVTRLQGTIDQVPVNGTLSANTGKPVSFQAKLKTGELDLDAYIPPPPENSATHPAMPMPNLALDLALEAKTLTWRSHRLDEVVADLGYTPHDGVRLDSVDCRFAGGAWHLSGNLRSSDQGWSGRVGLTARDASLAELRQADNLFPLVRGRVDLEADLSADHLDLKNFFENTTGQVTVSTRRPVQFADRLQSKVQGRIAAVLAPGQRVALDGELDSRFPDLKVSIKTEGTWDLQEMALEGDRTTLTIRSPALAGPEGALRLEGDLSLALRQRRASWRQTRVSHTGLGVTVQGDLEMAQVDGTPSIDANLEMPPVELRPFLAKVGIEVPNLQDPEVLGRLKGAGRFHFAGNQLAVRDLVLDVDDTQVRGVVDITAFTPFTARFELDADRVDLDRYWPRGKGAKPADRPTTANPIDIQGSLSVARLTLFRLGASDVKAEVKADRKELSFDPVQLTLYEGSTKGAFKVSLDGADPLWQTRAAASGVQLRQPLEILFHRPILSGRADIETQLEGRRRKGASAVAGLNGKLNFSARDGMIHGVRIVSTGEGAQPAGTPATDANGKPVQPFDLMEGSWTMTDGVATSEDHRLSAPGLNMASAGRVDFVQKRLDATLSADVSPIPVVYYAINGPFGDIRVRMDRARLVLDTTTGIVTSPLKLGKGTLGLGAEILERGGEAIGDDTGVQQLGQGAVTVGKGVLEVGQGVLEFHKGGESIEQGAKSVGEGVYGIGKGVVGVGKDALNVGLQALEGFAKGLERLFGGGGEMSTAEEGGESPSEDE